MKKLSAVIAAGMLLQIGCAPQGECIDDPHCIGGTAGDVAGATQAAASYPLTASPYTSLQQVWAPNVPSPSVLAAINDGSLSIYQTADFAANGLGITLQAGIPWVDHQELAPGFVEGSVGQRKSLAYIWVVADPQLIDEESPIRMEGFASLYRPHGQLTPQTFEAHVRTAQRISDASGRPFDFALLAGDLTDTTQENELDWVLTTLNGGIVDPDSGVDNDPVPGPGNDYNDPFVSDGITAPWYAAIGNHDVTWIGGLGVITEGVRTGAQGGNLYTGHSYDFFQWGGYVDGNTADHSVVLSPYVTTPADVARVPLTKTEVLQTLLDAGGAPAGHGLTQADVNAERAYYVVSPVAGKPLKMLVLDTTDKNQNNPIYTSLGSMDAIQLSWIQAELDTALANDELVIIMSHHRLQDYSDVSPVPGSAVSSLLASYDNVILHLTGHGHQNTKALQTVSGVGSYWELMTAATIDFPMQSRVVEIVDEGNGFLSIYVTNFDHNSEPGSLAHKGRTLAAAKLAFGTPTEQVDVEDFWNADKEAQNLLLRLPVSNAISANLENYTWSMFVESEETLNNF